MLGKRIAICTLVCAAVLAPSPILAQWTTQTIELTPGWNAVYLEVDPYPAECRLQLDGLPVTSVWYFDQTFSTLQFLTDPNQLVPDEPGWRVFVPEGSPAAFATNLYRLAAGDAYLIEATAAATWTVTGRPLLVRTVWAPNAYNLAGFSVDADNPPTLAQWFAPSAAHSPLEVWAFGEDKVWRPVADPASAPITAGKPYWVKCNGVSEYQGPLDISLPYDRILRFGRGVDEVLVGFSYAPRAAATVNLRLLESAPVPAPVLDAAGGELLEPLGGGVVLRYHDLLAGGGAPTYDFVDFPLTLNFVANENTSKDVRVAVDRRRMNGGPDTLHQSVLEITDGAGYRRLVGVTGKGRGLPLDETARRLLRARGLLSAADDPVAATGAGLWIGYVNVNQVAEPNVQPPELTPTNSTFTFRLILHRDAAGTVRLLNQVTELRRPETVETDPATQEPITIPERAVLMTGAAPQELRGELGTTYLAMTERDGRPHTNRASSAVFSLRDGEGSPEDPTMTLEGPFGEAGGSLSITLVLEDRDPTNPFHHQYHAIHGYPAADETPIPANDWTITRQLRLTFTDEPPDEFGNLAYGVNHIGGIYEETVTGLRRDPILSRGVFRLSLASDVLVLNDGLQGE